MGVPSVYLWDCNSAATIVNKFMLLADDHSVRWMDECRGYKNDGYPSPIIEEDSYVNGDLHMPKMSSMPSFKVVIIKKRFYYFFAFVKFTKTDFKNMF